MSHAELQQRVAELTELAGGLAHELRNPLSTVMVNLKLLAEDLQDTAVPPEDARRRALRRVQTLRHEAERLQGLFDEFLRLAGSWSVKLEPVDLREVVRRMVEFLEPLLHSHGVELIVELPDAPIMCLGDQKLLSQALLNLAINAQQAMPHGGVLRLSASDQTEGAVIEVSDAGVGIPPEQQAQIMRPFFSTKPGGTGLGLSLTKRIAEEHGGTVTFASEVGKGTTFTLCLPKADAT